MSSTEGNENIESADACFSIKFLGTGNAPGVPVRGCSCDVCIKAKANKDLRRESCCAVIEFAEHRILLDAGVFDLKYRFSENSLSAILLTHFHPDHVQGLFPFRWGGNDRIDTYAPNDKEGCGDLYKNPGVLNFRTLTAFAHFYIGEVLITPVPLTHSKITLGFCFEHLNVKIAYLTDTVGLPKKTEAFLRYWKPDVMVIDCAFPPQKSRPRNHNDINMVLMAYEEFKPKKMLLTHIGHQLDLWLNEYEHELPDDISVVRDNETYIF
ncbi:MAG: phosphonate metabolism protein PhnP [Methyloprofundus sp.]|nr:phosphonate metabolism protein PhnP [Methyloprofundus sp.]MDT8426647.1 phosphonate metabolism protein PhnP [Methyloprofundus sp.]